MPGSSDERAAIREVERQIVDASVVEYMESEGSHKTQRREGVRIVNVVASARWTGLKRGVPIDLKVISMITGARYDESIIKTAVMRFKSCTVTVFASGELLWAGSQTLDEGLVHVNRMSHVINRTLGTTLRISRARITNVVGVFRLGFKLDLDRIREEHPLVTNYNPEVFCGMSWNWVVPEASRPRDPEKAKEGGSEPDGEKKKKNPNKRKVPTLLLKVYSSGAVVVTKAKTPEIIQCAVSGIEWTRFRARGKPRKRGRGEDG